MLLQQRLPQIGLFALGTFEWTLSLVLVLPHVIVQVALCHKLFLANLARPRLHSVVFNPDVFVDRSLVEDLTTDWAIGVKAGLLSLWHEAAFMLLSNMSRQRRAVDEYFKAECALLWLLVMLPFFVPIKVSLSFKYLSTMTE